MSSSPATLRQMLERSLAAFQHMAAPSQKDSSPEIDWAVFCRHIASAVQIRPGQNLAELAISLEEKPNATDKERDTAALLYLLTAVLEPEARAFNNLAVQSAEAGDIPNALHWLRLGLSLFPDDPTLQENLQDLQN